VTPEDLRKLADEATPGPWMADGNDVTFGTQFGEDCGATLFHGAILYDAVGQGPKDARLGALAPDLARLCAELGEALDDIAVMLTESRTQRRWKSELLEHHARVALAKLSELEAR
jgi:hypothetical protein